MATPTLGTIQVRVDNLAEAVRRLKTARSEAQSVASELDGAADSVGETASRINNVRTELSAVGDAVSGVRREMGDAGDMADDMVRRLGDIRNIGVEQFQQGMKDALATSRRIRDNAIGIQQALSDANLSSVGPTDARLSGLGRNRTDAVRRRAAMNRSGVGRQTSAEARRAVQELSSIHVGRRLQKGVSAAVEDARELKNVAESVDFSGAFKDAVDRVEKIEDATKRMDMSPLVDSAKRTAATQEEITAGVKEMQAAIHDARTAMDAMSEQHPDYDEYADRIREAEARMDELRNSTKATAGQLEFAVDDAEHLRAELRQAAQNSRRFEYSTSDARQSAMALGNILSDAPHGLQGMANNVGELIEGFGNLRGQVGSVKGLLKAMAGPALLGGIVTGVVTLASKWDKVTAGIDNAVSSLSGMKEEVIRLEDAVDKLATNKLQEAIRGMDRETLQSLVKGYRNLRNRARPDDLKGPAVSRFGRTSMGTPMTTESEGPVFGEDSRKALITSLKELRKERFTIQQIALALIRSGEMEAPEALKTARKQFNNNDDSGSGSGDESATDYYGIRLPTIPGGVSVSGGNEFITEEDIYGASAPQVVPPSEVFTEEQLAPPSGLTETERARLRGRRARTRQIRRTARAMNIRDPFRRRMQVLEVRREGALTRNEARRQRLLAQREDVRRGVKAGIAGSEAKLKKVNAQIKQVRAERFRINRKFDKKEREARKRHAEKVRRQEQKAKQKRLREERRIRRQRLQGMRTFTSSMQRIGGALSSLYSTWRRQRVQELRKEGKSQKEINKKIREEGKRRFQFMKKVRIASAIANTISGAVTAYQGTIEALGGGPWAQGVAITNMLSTLATGYAQVKKLQQLSIGSGMPGSGGNGGASGSKYTQLSGKIRNRRVENTAMERQRDSANGRDPTSKTVREEEAKTREAIRKSQATGNEEAFKQRENARKREQKATS